MVKMLQKTVKVILLNILLKIIIKYYFNTHFDNYCNTLFQKLSHFGDVKIFS